MPDVVAAIDCGTNTARLLIRGDGRDLVRREAITRLGAGLAESGRLAPDAIERTAATMADFRSVLDEHGVETVRVVATSAARDAANRDELFARIESAVGVAPELLSGEEEGALAFRGATDSLDPARGPFCVIDIGGGSTEFAVGHHSLDRVMSVEMGSVRFTDLYVESDPPRPEELVACISVAEAYLSDVVRELPEVVDVTTYVAVAGTALTVAAVELGSAAGDHAAVHGFELDHAAAEDVFRTLVTEPLADRLHNPGLHPDRAEVIVAGSAILVATMRALSIESILVSAHDLLDGIVAELAGVT